MRMHAGIVRLYHSSRKTAASAEILVWNKHRAINVLARKSLPVVDDVNGYVFGVALCKFA